LSNGASEQLAATPRRSGPITDSREVAGLLAAAWNRFSGDDGGMEGRKLLGRMKTWPGTHRCLPLSSSGTAARCWDQPGQRCKSGQWTLKKRQLLALRHGAGSFARPNLDSPLAARRGGRQPDREWQGGSPAQVVRRWPCPGAHRKILPEGLAVKQTLAARRRRSWEAVAERLADKGWKECGVNIYERCGQAEGRTRSWNRVRGLIVSRGGNDPEALRLKTSTLLGRGARPFHEIRAIKIRSKMMLCNEGASFAA
jgi:hypothetical protein